MTTPTTPAASEDATQPAGGTAPAPPPASAPPAEVTLNVTPEGASDGVLKCVRCGASEVTFSAKTGMLSCAFCKHKWSEERLDEKMGLSEGIGSLKGTVLSSAAVDITDDDTLITMKCTGCGAEVVVDTDKNLQAKCHWCKSVLSINNTIPNGAVPDGILPFQLSKQDAMARIQGFVNERKTFAHPDFARSFRAENVMGVYMPYMTVDGNIAVRLDGVGEILRKRVQVNDKRTEYHADQYTVVRHLDMEIDDLIVETSSDKVNIHSTTSTNNIINAVLPFDVKNIVRFNSHYLGAEYTSERRDMDVDNAESYAVQHFMTLARSAAEGSVKGYDRGVRWEAEQVNVKGSRWTAVLLPVWLYGFVQKKGGKEITHYLAVNARTGATMGSVPINTGKAAALSWGLAIGISIITWPIGFVVLALS